MQTLQMPVDEIHGRPQAADEPTYVTSKEAADQLGVTQGRVRQLLGDGKLIGVKDGKDDWLVQLASVRRYGKYREAIDAAKNLMKGEADE